MANALFDHVVAASRLGPLVAPFTVTRLLLRADVFPDELTPARLHSAMAELEKGLAVYLRNDELEAAMQDLRSLVDA